MTAEVVVCGIIYKGGCHDLLMEPQWQKQFAVVIGCSLELRRRGIAEKIRTLELNDPHDWSINHRPAVERAAIPPIFRILVGELQSMEGEVPAVEEKYSVDCSKLKKSVENAVTQLEAIQRHIFCWRVSKYRRKKKGKLYTTRLAMECPKT